MYGNISIPKQRPEVCESNSKGIQISPTTYQEQQQSKNDRIRRVKLWCTCKQILKYEQDKVDLPFLKGCAMIRHFGGTTFQVFLLEHSFRRPLPFVRSLKFCSLSQALRRLYFSPSERPALAAYDRSSAFFVGVGSSRISGVRASSFSTSTGSSSSAFLSSSLTASA